jgi:hypothetical protein
MAYFELTRCISGEPSEYLTSSLGKLPAHESELNSTLFRHPAAVTFETQMSCLTR